MQACAKHKCVYIHTAKFYIIWWLNNTASEDSWYCHIWLVYRRKPSFAFIFQSEVSVRFQLALNVVALALPVTSKIKKTICFISSHPCSHLCSIWTSNLMILNSYKAQIKIIHNYYETNSCTVMLWDWY